MSNIIISTINMSIPLMLAALGGVFSVRAGIMALGLESMLLAGAFSAVLGSYYTGSPLIGFVFGIVGGGIIGLFHGVLSIRYKVNQVISGIGLNLLLVAITTLTMQLIWNNRGSTPQVASASSTTNFLKGIPLLGDLLGNIPFLGYVTFLLVYIGWVLLFKTKYGLRLRFVGENPNAANSVGLNVNRLKYSGVLISGMLAGLGGAFLSVNHLNMFIRDMSAGRGYIAVAIGILSRYNPKGVLIFSLMFGFADALQIILQGQNIPTQFVQMLPYLVTLIALVFGVRHIQAPAGLGENVEA